MDFLTALFWLTLNVYHEARGEEQIGQVAVAHVTLNRACKIDEFVETVVKSPYQFSWTHLKDDWTPNDLPALFKAFQSSVIAYYGYDFTGGATFYHSVKIKPTWAKKKVPVMTIGNHKIYKNPIMLAATKKKKKFNATKRLVAKR